MKKLFSVSVVALSIVAFPNTSEAFSSFKSLIDDFKEKVSNFKLLSHKAASKGETPEEVSRTADYPCNSISFSHLFPVNTISAHSLARKGGMPDSAGEKKHNVSPVSTQSDLSTFTGLEQFIDKLKEPSVGPLSRLGPSLNESMAGTKGVRKFAEDESHNVSPATSQRSFSKSAEDEEWEPHPQDDACSGSGNHFRDTVFLQLPINDDLKREIWLQKLFQRGKDYEKAKYPYRGFVNVKNTYGERAGRLTVGLKALFQIKEE